MVNISGINIVYATTTILLLSTFGIFARGLDTEAFDLILVFTGRLGLILFVLSFGASKFHAIFRAGWSKQLLKNRRYLGIAAALVMFLHLIWIYAKVLILPEWWVAISEFDKVFGIVTLLIVSVMGLTSNNTSMKLLGMKNWKRLHLIGGYIALWAFTMEYMPILFPDPESPEPRQTPSIAYLMFILILTVAIVRFWKSKFVHVLTHKKK